MAGAAAAAAVAGGAAAAGAFLVSIGAGLRRESCGVGAAAPSAVGARVLAAA